MTVDHPACAWCWTVTYTMDAERPALLAAIASGDVEGVKIALGVSAADTSTASDIDVGGAASAGAGAGAVTTAGANAGAGTPAPDVAASNSSGGGKKMRRRRRGRGKRGGGKRAPKQHLLNKRGADGTLPIDVAVKVRSTAALQHPAAAAAAAAAACLPAAVRMFAIARVAL